MQTTYLIWKNPPIKGASPDWQEITGKEFLALVRSPEGKNRHFIKLPSADPDGNDGAVVMETTKAGYLDWKREKNHSDYLRSLCKGRTVISYHAMVSNKGVFFGEEMLRDEDSGVEAEYFALFDRAEVRKALSLLSEDEQRMIEFLCMSERQGTEREYSALTGIPQKTINDRKKRALAKLVKIIS